MHFLAIEDEKKAMVICSINEEKFIEQYVELTGLNESLARNVYIHLESSYYQTLPR